MTSDMKQRSKDELIKELNQFLLIENVSWSLLPEADLIKLLEAFRNLKADVDQVFAILDEVLETPLTVVEDSKQEWRKYTI